MAVARHRSSQVPTMAAVVDAAYLLIGKVNSKAQADPKLRVLMP